MKDRKTEITELLAKHDARRTSLRNYVRDDVSIDSFESLLGEAFAEGYAFAKNEETLITEVSKLVVEG